jgi:hypothetical protein
LRHATKISRAPITTRSGESRRLPRPLTGAAAGLLTLTLTLVAGCGGGGGGSSSASDSNPESAASGGSKVAVTSLGPKLEPCVEQWNAASNQSVRFGFDGEVLAAVNTPRQKMLVTRTAGRCSLVFAGAGDDQPRIWTREAGTWSAQAVLAGETALTAEAKLAVADPNVTAAITTPPDEENTTVGQVVALPAAG